MSDLSGDESLGDLLRLLREADRELRVFGSTQHRYASGPALTEREIRTFESVNRIALPQDYRLFLQTVGNGGAGPYYGLEPLGTFGRDLSKPFLLTQATEGLSEDELDRFGDRDEYPGILEFCHQGCAIYSYLVVNGPTYGRIWDGREDFYPTGLSFDGWYRRWAERAIRALRNQPLANNLRVGMSKADVIAVAPSNWKARQALRRTVWYYEAPDIPVQLELDETDKVIKLNPWPFI